MDTLLVQSLVVTTLAFAAPLLLAALGELIGETSGVLNIGLEGMMLCGALAGAAVSFGTGNPWAGLGAAAVSGTLVAALFGLMVLVLRADPVVVGTGINLFALGITATLHRGIVARFPEYKAVALPETFFFGAGFCLVPLVWFLLQRTRPGLKLRAAGEHPAAAEVSGAGVNALRWRATLANGALCGIAGAFLTMSNVHYFVENVTQGRGFIALAIVIFGRWSPWGALGAALLFGAADALQITLQGRVAAAYPLLIALPYVLTLCTLAGFAGKSRAPAALGKHF